MRILRGVMLGVGLVMVFLAACADQWEPGRILAVGFIGLGLCAAGKLLPEKLPIKKKAAGRAATRTGGKGRKENMSPPL